MILGNLSRSVGNARKVLRGAIAHMPDEVTCSCQSALGNAIATVPSHIPNGVRESLRPLLEKYLKAR